MNRPIEVVVMVEVDAEPISEGLEHAVKALVHAILQAHLESYDVDANDEDEGYRVTRFAVVGIDYA